MAAFFWGQNFTKWQTSRGLFDMPLFKSKDRDASNSPDFKTHNLRLAAISTAPLEEIAEGSIPTVLV